MFNLSLRGRLWLAAAALLVGVSPAPASVVVPMNLDTLADHAGQVIVGEVTSVRSYWAEQPKRIESEVVLNQVEYLKGGRANSTTTFTLVVPGGTVDGMQARLCCAPQFAVGEKWVLCLLPVYKTHPVVGLYQGAFLVEEDDQGVEHLAYRRHGVTQPVVGLDDDGFVQVAAPQQRDAHGHLLATHGLRVEAATKGNGPGEAMTYEAFLERLRPVLAASRDHELTGPAGRRVSVEYRAVPLRRSPLQQQRDRTRETEPTAGSVPGRTPPPPARPAGSGKEVQP